MTTLETLQQHLRVCDELYQLAHEENHHLKQHRRVPEAALLERKRALLVPLDETLTALRASHGGMETSREIRALVEKVRGRIFQILQLDKENEQLLLRVSLSRGIETAVAPAVAPALLQKIYSRATA